MELKDIQSGSPDPTGTSGSMSFTVIPAPGAIARLGMAGLSSRRRRAA